MLASVDTWNPFALVALDLGILVASHLGIQKTQTGYSRSILVLSCSWHRNGFRFGTRVINEQLMEY